jgi:predicted nucleic acid-binding protein
MYLIDTDFISEARKGARANAGVQAFFADAVRDERPLYLSVVTVGELRLGVGTIRCRGDGPQAQHLEQWLDRVTLQFKDSILPIEEEIAHVWGKPRVPNRENPLDKQIAATALVHALTVFTRNVAYYSATGAALLNPFS